MLVIADVVLAVTMVSVASRAVTELQFRIRNISSSADGTFVCVIRNGLFLRKGDATGFGA